MVVTYEDHTCDVYKMEDDNEVYFVSFDFLINGVKEIASNKEFLIVDKAIGSTSILFNVINKKSYPLGKNYQFSISPSGILFYDHKTQELQNLETQKVIFKSNFCSNLQKTIKVCFSPDDQFVILVEKTGHRYSKLDVPIVVDVKTGKALDIIIDGRDIEKLLLLPYGKIIYYIPGEDRIFSQKPGYYRLIDTNNIKKEYRIHSYKLSINKKHMLAIDFYKSPILINLETNEEVRLSEDNVSYYDDIGSRANKKSNFFLALLESYSEKKEFDFTIKCDMKKIAQLINLTNYEMEKKFDITGCDYTYNGRKTKFLFQDKRKKESAMLISLDDGNISEHQNVEQFIPIPKSSNFLVKTKEGKTKIIA